MKPLLLFLALLSNFLGSKVINAQNKSQKCDPDSCISLLPSETVQQYITNYEKDYNEHYNTVHSLKIEYPKEYFRLLNSFLINNKKYDGIRFVFGSFNNKYNGQDMSDSNQIIVMAAPTIKKIAKWSELKNFNNGKKFINNYTRNVKLFNYKNERKNPSNLVHDLFIFPTKDSAEKYSSYYRNKFPDTTKYSTSLYLCKSNFFLINELLESEMGASVDAIALMFVHYNKIIKSTGQIGEMQISLALIPSIDGQPQFNLLKDFIESCPKKSNQQKVNMFSVFALNHGELCPNSCK